MRLLPLTATERAILALALDNPALRTAPDVASAIDRLGDKLSAATRQIEETPSGLALTGPEKSGAIKEGLLLLLNGAVRDRTPVSLHYRSLWSGSTAWRGLDPYNVFHRENAWYLVGHCHLRQELRAFRLDRIADAALLDGTFAPPDFDLDEFLKHSWGIYHGRTVYEVVIHFDAALAALLEESTLHHELLHNRLRSRGEEQAGQGLVDRVRRVRGTLGRPRFDPRRVGRVLSRVRAAAGRTAPAVCPTAQDPRRHTPSREPRCGWGSPKDCPEAGPPRFDPVRRTDVG